MGVHCKKLTEDLMRQIYGLYKEGKSPRMIAALVDISEISAKRAVTIFEAAQNGDAEIAFPGEFKSAKTYARKILGIEDEQKSTMQPHDNTNEYLISFLTEVKKISAGIETLCAALGCEGYGKKEEIYE